jgi:hypothetical protein
MKATDIPIPRSYKEAMASSESASWKEAIQSEMKSLDENKTWTICDLPPGCKAIGCKLVFDLKLTKQGEIDRFKARLVALGYSQRYGIDYVEVFAPVANFDTIRLVLAISATLDLEIEQIDIKTAFLNGVLEETIYMKLPDGRFCRLLKGLYGLKQAQKIWHSTFDEFLRSVGFKPCASDPCLYVLFKRGLIAYIIIYVDDACIASNSKEFIKQLIARMARRFKLRHLGPLSYFLGLSITRERANRTLKIDQAAFLKKILNRHGMHDCNTIATPGPTTVFSASMCPENPIPEADEYATLVGEMLYAARGSRPDLAAPLSTLCRFVRNPSQQMWTSLKRVLRYVSGTLELGIIFDGLAEPRLTIVAWSDADWASADIDTRRSRSGDVTMMANGPVSWSSKFQRDVATSTVHAEYGALFSATKGVMHLSQTCKELNFPQHKVVVYEDNIGAQTIANGTGSHRLTRHFDIRLHYVKQMVEDAVIIVTRCDTKEMIADLLTKTSMSRAVFEYLRGKCMG